MNVYKCTPLELLETELREAEKAHQDIELRLQVLRGQVEVKRAQEAQKTQQEEDAKKAREEVERLHNISGWTETIDNRIRNALGNLEAFEDDLDIALPAELVRLRSDLLKALELFNAYGPPPNKDLAYRMINVMEDVAVKAVEHVGYANYPEHEREAIKMVRDQAAKLRLAL